MKETLSNIETYIEQTILKPEAARHEIQHLLDEAIRYKFFGVCINPVHVNLAAEHLKNTGIKVVTVIGFPLGANTSKTKAYESQNALQDGADELDMVINIGALKDKNYNLAEEDIKAVVDVSGEKIVKVIIETDLLNREEIIEACKIAINAGANFVKSSTGFVKNGTGATPENIRLMHQTVSPYGLSVKASGGIRDRETAIKMIEAGAVRIGTSSGVKIITG